MHMAQTFFSFLGAMLVGILAVIVVEGPIAVRVATFFMIAENTAMIAMTLIAVIGAFLAFRFAAFMNGGSSETFIEHS